MPFPAEGLPIEVGHAQPPHAARHLPQDHPLAAGPAGPPGAPANGLTVTQLAAVRQLQQCARVRKHCAPKVVALMNNTPAADLTTMVPVPTAEAIERAVSSLFGGASNVASDKFRSWAAMTASVATLFAPLTR